MEWQSWNWADWRLIRKIKNGRLGNTKNGKLTRQPKRGRPKRFIRCDFMKKMGRRAENYDQLFDLFAQEHFLSIWPEETREAICDKSLGSVQEAADLAEPHVQSWASSEHKAQRKERPHFIAGKREGGWEPRHAPPQNWLLKITFTNPLHRRTVEGGVSLKTWGTIVLKGNLGPHPVQPRLMQLS